MKKLNAEDVIKILDLKPLIGEGGFYRQNIKSDETFLKGSLDGRKGERPYHTGIYYLVTDKAFSKMHKLTSDEVFHFYMGDPCIQLQLYSDGSSDIFTLGNDIINNEIPQLLCKRGVWQGTMKLEGAYGWSLLGTTMGPGYSDNDFEVCPMEKLIEKYPDRENLIKILGQEANYDI